MVLEPLSSILCMSFVFSPRNRFISNPSCNDKENDRMAYDSILSERALREIYLMPFMLAQKHAKPWSFMTA